MFYLYLIDFYTHDLELSLKLYYFIGLIRVFSEIVC